VQVIVRRVIQLIVVLVVVTFFTSILTALLPGDPVTTIAPFSSAQDRATIRDQLNLNENIVVRYGKWLEHFVTGDMGREYAGTGVRGQSISERIKDSLPRSLILMLYVQILTLLIAVPLGVATALYLTEMAPVRLRQPVMMVVEMLAAVPSVILGLWGIFVMVPFLRDHFFPLLQKYLGFLPLFQGPHYGPCMLAAGIILAIMIVPIITSISREILRSVPGLQREAAYALGATRWEVTRIAVLSYAKKGLFGAVILGLGRALGETMAVTFVIGNAHRISSSLLAPGTTISSAIANEFTEAVGDLYTSSLIALGLLLFLITFTVIALAQAMLRRLERRTGAVA